MVNEKQRATIESIVQKVEGWLWHDAAVFTADLFAFQRTLPEFDPSLGVLEFGTYKGKYLSLFYLLTGETKAPVYGIDIFELAQENDVRNAVISLFGNDNRLHLTKANTREVSPDRLKSLLGGKALNFISVDAEHSCEGVLNDLRLSEAFLSPTGIIAVDDFTNVHCPGVTEGAIRFLIESNEIKPFASVCNKLFLCRKEMADLYYERTLRFAVLYPDTVSAKRYHTRTRSQNEQRLCGQPTLVLSHTVGNNPGKQPRPPRPKFTKRILKRIATRLNELSSS